jgi:hypothetical protein
MDTSVADWLKSPFSGFSGSPAGIIAADNPGAAAFPSPPVIDPAAGTPPVVGAAAVNTAATDPAST